MQDDEFEWDDAKSDSNLQKHGVSFEDARLVFRDAFAIEQLDNRADYGEDRFVLTGMAKGFLLVVVYTEREDQIRIISARKADKQETDGYYQNQTSE